MKTAGVKLRYRTETCSAAVIKYLMRAGIYTGRKSKELSKSAVMYLKPIIISAASKSKTLLVSAGIYAGQHIRLLFKIICICLKNVLVSAGLQSRKLLKILLMKSKSAVARIRLAVLENKKKTAIGALGVCVFVLCSITAINGLTAYQYSYRGQVLGFANSEK